MVRTAWNFVTDVFSAEWVLTRCHYPNGGGVILFRAAFVSLTIYLGMISFRNFIDPARSWDLSLVEFRLQARSDLPAFGAILAAAYAALYARFSSQWTYLAGVYNQIKAAQCRSGECPPRPLAEWKAGFIADAMELHLADKALFASVISEWGRDSEVVKVWGEWKNGSEELKALMIRVDRIMEREPRGERVAGATVSEEPAKPS
jgi:hypothetical protein